MNKESQEKCKSCVYYDNERSSKGFTVCSNMDMNVLTSNSSLNCKNYKPKDNE